MMARTSHNLDKLQSLLRNSSEFRFLVAAGLIPGVTQIHEFGRNSSVSTAEDMIGTGVTLANSLGPASRATRLRIRAGGNAADDAAGAGARSVRVVMLDENFNLVNELIPTAGASASAYTTANARRLVRAYLGQVGTYNGNAAAAITIEDEGGFVRGILEVGLGQSQLGHFTVPAGSTLIIAALTVKIEGGKSATLRTYQRWHDEVETISYPRRLVLEWPALTGGTIEHEVHSTWEVYRERTDFFFTAQSTASTAAVDVEFEGYLLDNDRWPEAAALAAETLGA